MKDKEVYKGRPKNGGAIKLLHSLVARIDMLQF